MTAVRPPELAPRLPYAALLLAADRVVLADTFPYSRQSGQGRMRIATVQGPQWLSVPRHHAGLGVPLDQVEIAGDDWRTQHRRALRMAHGRAPFYEHVAPEWDDVLDTTGPLADLSVASVHWAARWLKADAEIVRASQLPGAPARLDAVLDRVEPDALLTLPESADRDAQVMAERGGPTFVLHLDGDLDPALSVMDLVMTHGLGAADVLRAAMRVEAF